MRKDKTVLSTKHQKLLETLCSHEDLDSLEYARRDPNFVLDQLLAKLIEEMSDSSYTNTALRWSIEKDVLDYIVREREEAQAKKAA